MRVGAGPERLRSVVLEASTQSATSTFRQRWAPFRLVMLSGRRWCGVPLLAALCLLAQLATQLAARRSHNVTNLYLIGLFPFSGNVWPAGEAAWLGAALAIEHINERDDVLADYRLQLLPYDTQCIQGVGLNAFIGQLQRPPVKIAVLGGGCAAETIPITAITSYAPWQMLVVSWGAEVPELSDRSRYPHFFRTVSPGTARNPPKIALFDEFGWKKFATIAEAGPRSDIMNDLLSTARSGRFEILTSEVIQTDAAGNVLNLKNKDARIIVHDSFEPTALRTMCAAYELGLYGPKYAWFIPEWYSTEWWLAAPAYGCSPENVLDVIDGAIATTFLFNNPADDVSVANLTNRQFRAVFNERKGNRTLTSEDYASPTYDATWAIALALDMVARENANVSLGDFAYGDTAMNALITAAMQRVQFVGVSVGAVRFSASGDLVGKLEVLQFRNRSWTRVAVYVPDAPAGQQLQWQTPIWWRGGHVPIDAAIVTHRWLYVSWSVYVPMIVLASIGLLLSGAFLVFNVAYRQRRAVKMSSPRINALILVGCMLAYAHVFIDTVGESARPTPALCFAKTATLVYGFSLCFGSLLSKTWRVYKIFTDVRLKKRPILDQELVVFVAVLVALNTAVLVTWQAVDPLQVVTSVVSTEASDSSVVITKVTTCTSSQRLVFVGVLVGLQGVLLLFGCFLAFQTRSVKVAALNDSHAIGVCVYNIFILGLFGVAVNFLLDQNPPTLYLICSLLIVVATTVTQCTVFVPKVLKRNSVETTRRTSVGSSQAETNMNNK